VRIAWWTYDFVMPRDASTTRDRLLDAAAHEFAEHGVWNASLIEVTRRAGQRNRAALRYHFGTREQVLCAVLERHVEFLAQREGELLAKARRTPDDDVGAVVEAIVRPAAELAASGWRGRACLLIVAELAGEDPARFSPELESVLARTGGNEVYAVLEQRMPPLPREIVDERNSLITSFILHAVADRERAKARTGRPSRHVLADEAFVENLVLMVAGAVSTGWPA
jgi:AcrR family transcriptional regulator